jgi:hypothetical protein
MDWFLLGSLSDSMRQIEPPLALIVVSATGQKDVRQKNGNSYFSVSHPSARWPGVAGSPGAIPIAQKLTNQ